jgi:phage N-6-adenine-methyltransferase
VSVVGYRARNHPQQVRTSGAMRAVDDRATMPEDFAPLHKRFAFTIDVAASAANAKCARYFTEDDDGLAQSWAGERVYCNPPYSHPNLERWVAKAWQEWTGSAELIVTLVPANRTEQLWWQGLVEPYRDREGSPLHVEFLAGRLQFAARGATGIKPNERPPFGCCLLIWDGPRTGGPAHGWKAPDGQDDLFGGAS